MLKNKNHYGNVDVQGHKEANKNSLVASSNAVIEPGTVMIIPFDTFVAYVAVLVVFVKLYIFAIKANI